MKKQTKNADKKSVPETPVVEPNAEKLSALPPLELRCPWCQCWIPKGEDCLYCDGPLEGEEKMREHRQKLFDELTASRTKEWKDGAWERVGVPPKYAKATISDFGRRAKQIRELLWERTWIFTGGPNGTGKTHLLAACCRECFIWGRAVRWTYVPDLVSSLTRDAYADGLSIDDVVEPYTHCYDLLAMDDLGKGVLTARGGDFIRRIINGRYNQNRAMAISSNKTLKAFGKDAEDLAGRISEQAVPISLRKVRPERKY
jgi:DNA replication protein DnaC